jgi:hypothetical protein
VGTLLIPLMALMALLRAYKRVPNFPMNHLDLYELAAHPAQGKFLDSTKKISLGLKQEVVFCFSGRWVDCNDRVLLVYFAMRPASENM